MNERHQFIKQFIGTEIKNSPSAVTNWLAMIPTMVEVGSWTAKLTVRKDMTNMAGTLHGGITATILDDMCGIVCLISGEDHFYSTINLSIDYLSGAVAGEELLATARIVRKGKNIVNVEAELRKQDDKLVAKASSNLMVTSPKTS